MLSWLTCYILSVYKSCLNRLNYFDPNLLKLNPYLLIQYCIFIQLIDRTPYYQPYRDNSTIHNWRINWAKTQWPSAFPLTHETIPSVCHTMKRYWNQLDAKNWLKKNKTKWRRKTQFGHSGTRIDGIRKKWKWKKRDKNVIIHN